MHDSRFLVGCGVNDPLRSLHDRPIDHFPVERDRRSSSTGRRVKHAPRPVACISVWSERPIDERDLPRMNAQLGAKAEPLTALRILRYRSIVID